jgi:hypothetical protein
LREDEAHFVVQKLADRLSTVPLNSSGKTSPELEQVVEQFALPDDCIQVLMVSGTILPYNRSIVVLTAEVAKCTTTPLDGVDVKLHKYA